MTVSAVIKITQFETYSSKGTVRDITGLAAATGGVRDITASVESDFIQQHLPAIVNPYARAVQRGWKTGSTEWWSDSPTNQPNLLYRYRYSWGRDKAELFEQPGIPALTGLYPDGVKWGALEDNHGQLIYQVTLPISATGSVRDFKVEGSGSILDKDTQFYSTAGVQDFEAVSGDTTVSEFPFLLIAEPDPFSEKNPVATDVFIRLGNYAFPLVSGTINLYLDDELQANLQIEEFFGGLGGFNVTWVNSDLFEYDAQVDVHWEFRDSDVPANRFDIRYPFYTVKDLAGPRVTGLVPVDGTTSIPVVGPLQFTVEDYENDVDIGNLSLYVNNVLIVSGDNGTIETTRLTSGRGYTVVFTPEESWLYGDLIPVAIFINDTSTNENETFFAYSFTTVESTAPRLINITPAPCTVGVPTGTDIIVDVIDGGHGLDPDSIVFTVEEIERGSTIQLIPIVHRDD